MAMLTSHVPHYSLHLNGWNEVTWKEMHKHRCRIYILYPTTNFNYINQIWRLGLLVIVYCTEGNFIVPYSIIFIHVTVLMLPNYHIWLIESHRYAKTCFFVLFWGFLTGCPYAPAFLSLRIACLGWNESSSKLLTRSPVVRPHHSYLVEMILAGQTAQAAKTHILYPECLRPV